MSLLIETASPPRPRRIVWAWSAFSWVMDVHFSTKEWSVVVEFSAVEVRSKREKVGLQRIGWFDSLNICRNYALFNGFIKIYSRWL